MPIGAGSKRLFSKVDSGASIGGNKMDNANRSPSISPLSQSSVSSLDSEIPPNGSNSKAVASMTAFDERLDYVIENKVPMNSQEFKLVSSEWLDAFKKNNVSPVILAQGAAGEKVALPVFEALDHWYRTNRNFVAYRIIYVDSNRPAHITSVASGNTLAEALDLDMSNSPVVYAGQVHSLFVTSAQANVESMRRLKTEQLVDSLDLGPNDSLVVLGAAQQSIPGASNSNIELLGEVIDLTDDSEMAGQIGLVNMGNTCFMNSSLQALIHIPELIIYFGGDKYIGDINRENPIGCRGLVADAFATLIKEFYGMNESNYRPYQFRNTIGRFNRSFSSYMQQDSQEFTVFLLDSLHEDLNRVKQKPSTEKPELGNAEDPADRNIVAKLAQESWITHGRRNDSKIMDLFTGMYKSTLICPVCAKVSITFDPFFDLTLPLPRRSSWIKPLTFVPLDTKSPAVLTEVALDGSNTVRDLASEIVNLFNLSSDASQLLVAKIYDHEFLSLLDHDEIASDAIATYESIAVYESGVSSSPFAGNDEALHDSDEMEVSTLTGDLREPVPQKISVPVQTRHKGQYAGAPFFVDTASLNRYEIAPLLVDRIKQLYKVPTGFDASSIGIKVFHGSIDDIGAASDDSQFLPLESEAFEKIEPIAPHEETDEVLELSESGHSSARDVTSGLDTSRGNMGIHERAELSSRGNSGQTGQLDSRGRSVLDSVSPVSPASSVCLQASSPGQSPEIIGSPTSSFAAESPMSSKTYDFVEFVRSKSARAHLHDPTTHSLEKSVLIVDLDANVLPVEHSDLDVKTNPSAEVARSMPEKHLSLEDSLRQFSNIEVLGDDDLWYCPRCKEFRKAEKQLELWKTPDILMIHLKRFSGAQSMAQKVTDLLDFPLDNFDLEPYLSPVRTKKDDDDFIYDLVAVDNHFGGIGGGHYTAYVRNLFGQRKEASSGSSEWLNFNDSHVSEISSTKISSPAAYLLFYRRRSLKAPLEETSSVIRQLRNPPTTLVTHDDSEVFKGTGQRLGTSTDTKPVKMPWDV